MKFATSFFALALFLVGCSTKTLFTQQHRNDIESYQIPLDKIQVFTRDVILIKRLESETERDLSNGRLNVKSQTLRKIIKFNSKTDGVVSAQKEDGIKVQFEEGENRELEFLLNRNGWYELVSNNGRIWYEGQEYAIVEGQRTPLLFDKRILTKTKTKRRTVKGLKVRQ